MAKKVKQKTFADDRALASRAGKTRQAVRYDAQQAMRDEFLQILISALNETWKGQTKANKYLLVDRLIALGLGLEIQVGTKKFQFAPDKGAIKEILDRLIGKPVQAIAPDGGAGSSGRVTLIFDADGDDTGDLL